MKALICLLAVGTIFQITTSASLGSVVFDDDYGTNAGRVSHSVRWEANPSIAPSSIVNNSTDFTAAKTSVGLMQVQVPVAKVGNGSGTPFVNALTFEFGLVANPQVGEVRMAFTNPNVQSIAGGFPSRVWDWRFDSAGNLYDDFAGGNVLATGFNPLAYHVFTLTIADPISGNGLLSINGGNQDYVIPIGDESDRTVQAFVRTVNGTAGQAVRIDHAILDAIPRGLWVRNGLGDWNVGGNWVDGIVPNSIDARASFRSAISAPRTIVVDAPVTVGSLEFDNANAYNIAGAASVTLQKSSGTASIQVISGQHQFQAVVNLVNDVDANIHAGASLSFNNSLNLAGNELQKTGAGTLLINNTMNLGNGPLTVVVGTVAGVGKVSGDLANVGGTVAPGVTAGALAVGGNYSQSSGGTLNIELGGTSSGKFDRLLVTGSAVLGGSLDVDLINSFMPSAGDVFQIVSSANCTGAFSNTPDNMLVTSAGVFAVTYSATGVTLSNFASYSGLAGDYDNNEVVDILDYIVWRMADGTSATLPNDPIGGPIDDDQYDQWRANFGSSTSGSGATSPGVATVPEPTSIALLAIAAFVFMPHWRARCSRPRPSASSVDVCGYVSKRA